MTLIQEILQSDQRSNFNFLIEDDHKGRAFAIGDIHGCLKTFNHLLSRINLLPEDKLFLLGDYINKGPDSVGVLKRILELVNKGYQIYPLRGNHEEMAIGRFEDTNDLGIENLKESCTEKERKDIERLILNLPIFYTFKEYFLVHAGINLSAEDPISDTKSMVWMRNLKIPDSFPKTVVHGHDPLFLDSIISLVDRKSKAINLDNGCCYKNKTFLGNLICFDLRNRQLIVQENIE